MVKILHAADFHLDSPFAGLTSEQARARRREGRENIARLANYANAGHVDLYFWPATCSTAARSTAKRPKPWLRRWVQWKDGCLSLPALRAGELAGERPYF